MRINNTKLCQFTGEEVNLQILFLKKKIKLIKVNRIWL